MTKKTAKKPSDNLIPVNKRTMGEQREIVKKGGKKSGEVRRQRKALRDLFKSMLATPLPNDDLKAKIEAMGFSDEENNYNTLLGMTTLNKALKGDVRAIEFVRDTIGEKPKEEIEISEAPKIVDDIK